MALSFGGISSGLPVNDIIRQLMAIERRPITLLNQRKDRIATQQSQYTAVSSRTSALRDSLNKLTDANLGTSFDLFQARRAASSDATRATVSVTNGASEGSFTLDVLQLATATKAASTTEIGAKTTSTANLANVAKGAITSGNFTVFINNQARTISVTVDKTSGDTMQAVIDRVANEIATVTGAAATGTVNASGQVELSYQAGTTIRFGAATDTSNFAQVTHMLTGTSNSPTDDTFTAQYGTSTIDVNGKLIGNAVGLQTNTIAAGTFKIGTKQFTIDANTTLAGIISQINGSPEAGVLVSYNVNTNKLEMVSKTTGNQAIFMEDNGTNFLTSVGLVSGTNSFSSQTLGQNAQIKINGGNTLSSTSNAISSAVSGLSGVTLNLVKQTDVGSPITITINNDTTAAKDALKDILNRFNTLIGFIDEQTKKGAVLSGENRLTSFRNEIRRTITTQSTVPGLTTYKTLSQIGITSGNVNSNFAQGSVSKTFSMTDADFDAAFAANPDEVKKLLIGDGTNAGIISTMKSQINAALDPEFGIFSSRDTSANNQIKAINDAIARQQQLLEAKEALLRKQFNTMDQMISQFRSQQSYIGSLGASQF